MQLDFNNSNYNIITSPTYLGQAEKYYPYQNINHG